LTQGTEPDLLVRRRAEALMGAAEAASADPPDLARSRQLLDEVRTIDELQSIGPDARSRQLAKAVAFASVAVVLAVLSFDIRVGGNAVGLQARVDEVSITAGQGSGLEASSLDLRSVRAAGLTVDGAFQAAPNLSAMTSITELQPLDARTAITIKRIAGRCFGLRVPKGKLQLTLAGGPDERPESHLLELDQGGTVEFCPTGTAKIVARSPGNIRLAALWEETTPPTYLSSIQDGVLEYPASKISRRLRPDQRIELIEPKGLLVVGLGDWISLTFSGSGSAQQFTALGPQTGGSSLKPTLAEVVRSSPVVASITAALAGIWGFLWSLSRLLSRR
jgi:hypothetical protein